MHCVACELRRISEIFETPHDRPPAYALMITIYLDESRHGDPDSLMVVAGFYGKKEQWEALVPDWTSALGKKKSLHMKSLRLNSPTGAKRGRRVIGKLGPLPYKHGLTPIFGAVKTGDYMEIIQDTYLKAQLPGYVICLTAVMQKLSRAIPGHETIKVVCEMQRNYESIARQTFKNVSRADPISRPERPYFGGIEFIPKDYSVLTQPSDCLAYAIAEWYQNSSSQKSEICRPIMGPTGEVNGLVLPRDDIRRMVRNVRNSAMFKILTGKR